MKVLRYLFFRIWQWKTKSPQEDIPLLVTAMVFSMLLTFNVLAAFLLSVLMSGNDWFSKIDADRRNILLLSILGGIFIPVYDSWVRRSGYERIAQEFATENKDHRRWRTVFVLSYVVASFIAPFVLAIVIGRSR